MSITELLRSVTGARQTLHEQFNELRQQEQRLKRERETLAAMPRPREEVIATIESLLRSNRPKYVNALSRYVRRLDLRNPAGEMSPDARASFNPLAIDEAGARTRNAVGNDDIPMFVLTGLLEDSIRPALRQALEDMSYPQAPGAEARPADECGPPMAERQRRLEELDEEIKRIDKELAELRRQASAAGLDTSKLQMPL